jgi:glutamate carboxypeptidase
MRGAEQIAIVIKMSLESYAPYLAWIDQQYSRMVTLVEQWSLVNSGSSHLAGLDKMRQQLVKTFASLDGRIEEHPLPDRKVVDDAGNVHLISSAKAISIVKRPEAKQRLLFCGHYDTVYFETDPFQTTVRRSDDILNGPGVADMKGGLIIMLIALEAFERSPWASRIGWEILMTPDEEIGSPSSTPLLQAAAKRASCGLVFEPAMEGCLVNQRKGSLNCTLVVRGKRAHAGRDFHLGHSAVYALSHFIHLLEECVDPHKEITINVGHIQGGGGTNVVPDLAICGFNIRARDKRDFQEIRKKIDSLIAICSKRTGIVFELFEDSYREPKPYEGAVVQLFDQMRSCAGELGLPTEMRLSGGVCDGNTLAAAGLPTIDSLGAEGGHLHSSEEYLVLPSLVQRAKLVALFLMKGEYLWSQ